MGKGYVALIEHSFLVLVRIDVWFVQKIAKKWRVLICCIYFMLSGCPLVPMNSGIGAREWVVSTEA